MIAFVPLTSDESHSGQSPSLFSFKMSYNSAEAEIEIQRRHRQQREATNAAFRAARPANTLVAYRKGEREWRAFCEDAYQILSPENRYTVDADKLHAFLLAMSETTKRRGPLVGETRGRLSYASLYAMMAGVIALWSQQREAGINSHPHPAAPGSPAKIFMKTRKSGKLIQSSVEMLLKLM